MSSITVLIKKLSPDAIIPTRATPGSAGFDLYAIRDYEMNEHEIIETGIAMDIPPGFVGLVFARSGKAFKKKVTLSNSVGVVDSDYRGEVKVALSDLKKETQVEEIKKGDKIAQILFMELPYVGLQEVPELGETKRGEGGFGSSGR